MRCSNFKIGIAIHGIIDQQVACEYFTEYALSFVSRTRYRF